MQINQKHLHEMNVKAIKQVFDNMLEEEAVLKSGDLVTDASSLNYAECGIEGEIRGIRIGFDGDFSGEYLFYYSQELALGVTRKFFLLNEVEMEDEELAESIDEILGELANMASGLFKSALLHTSLKCMITLPAPFKGGSEQVKQGSEIAFRSVCQYGLLGLPMLCDVVIYG